ncbi:DUF5753 domain-containing protein [Streptomyces kronopolitis]|uniref:DUF5753 domain-containing protein n=1 Tax=Streptomyces kronopolitis TaxID=1612435 RepID=UPI0036BC1899
MGSLYCETRVFRVYSSTLLPGQLQTEGYAAAVLRTNAESEELPFDDSTEAARARVERARITHEPGHESVLAIEEAVLYHQFGDREAMAAQLDHLLTIAALSSVSLGIIPKRTHPRVHLPHETFHVYDERLVSVELLSAEVKITKLAEVALYLKAFEQLRSMAVDGPEARALIQKARDGLR